MSIRSTTELSSVVGKDGGDCRLMFFKERQHIFIENMNGRNRQFARIQPTPGISRMAVYDGLKINPSDSLEGPDKEGVNSDEIAGVLRLNVPCSEFWTESFKQSGLVVGQGQVVFSHLLLETKQSLLPC